MSSLSTINIVGKSLATLVLAHCLRRQGIAYQFYANDRPAEASWTRWQQQYGHAKFALQAQTKPLLVQITGLTEPQLREKLSSPGKGSALPRRRTGFSPLRKDESPPIFTDFWQLETLLSQGLDFRSYSDIGHLRSEDGHLRIHFGHENSIRSSFTVTGLTQGGPFAEQLFKSFHIETLPFLTVSGSTTCPPNRFKRLTRSFRRGYWDGQFEDKGHRLSLQLWEIHNDNYRDSLTGDRDMRLGWFYSRRRYRNDAMWNPASDGAARQEVFPVLEADIKRIQAQYSNSDPVGTIFSHINDFGKNRPHIETMRSYLISREDSDRLAEHGFVAIGGAAHTLPSFGLILYANSVQAAVTDGVTLADSVADHGPTQQAIHAFYDKRYPEWQKRHNNVHKLVDEVHQYRGPRREVISMRKIKSGPYIPPKRRKTVDQEPKVDMMKSRLGSRDFISDEDTESTIDPIQGPAFIPASVGDGDNGGSLFQIGKEHFPADQQPNSEDVFAPSDDVSGPMQWYLSPPRRKQRPQLRIFRPQPDEEGVWHLHPRGVISSTDADKSVAADLDPDPKTRTKVPRTEVPALGGAVTPRFVTGSVPEQSAEYRRHDARRNHEMRVLRERAFGEGKPWSGKRQVPPPEAAKLGKAVGTESRRHQTTPHPKTPPTYKEDGKRPFRNSLANVDWIGF